VVWTNEALRGFFGLEPHEMHGHDKRKLMRDRCRYLVCDGREFPCRADRSDCGASADTDLRSTYIERHQREVAPCSSSQPESRRGRSLGAGSRGGRRSSTAG
jgi:hypothetical protein